MPELARRQIDGDGDVANGQATVTTELAAREIDGAEHRFRRRESP